MMPPKTMRKKTRNEISTGSNKATHSRRRTLACPRLETTGAAICTSCVGTVCILNVASAAHAQLRGATASSTFSSPRSPTVYLFYEPGISTLSVTSRSSDIVPRRSFLLLMPHGPHTVARPDVGSHRSSNARQAPRYRQRRAASFRRHPITAIHACPACRARVLRQAIKPAGDELSYVFHDHRAHAPFELSSDRRRPDDLSESTCQHLMNQGAQPSARA